MTYEPIYERFGVTGPDGSCFEVSFVRAGFLTQGDRPELFFFLVNGEETVVGISSLSLARFERGLARRLPSGRAGTGGSSRLSREQKIDIAGRWLKRQIAVGLPLDSRSLYIQDNELANLASELNFTQ